MKQPCIIYFFLLLFISGLTASAQIQVQNGGMEQWSGFNLIRPDYWGITEQAVGVKTNKWVSRETNPDYLNSGTAAVRLYSDTSAALHGSLLPGMIAYGRVSLVHDQLITSGRPIYGRPSGFSFYMRVFHPVVDTASMTLLLTRWNPTRNVQDTLACEQRYILADTANTAHFVFYNDSIIYRMDGQADTAHIIIMGGRSGDVNLRGNTVWVDDMSFNYAEDDDYLSMDEDIFLFPNPAITKVSIQADAALVGYSVIFMDITGLKVKEVAIDEGTTTIDVSDLVVGTYCYAILDRDKALIHDGNINISRP
jgi:hypothetical protein